MNNWKLTVCSTGGLEELDVLNLSTCAKSFKDCSAKTNYWISISKLPWPVIVSCHSVTKSLGKVKQLGASSSWSQISSSLERALDPSTPACKNNVVANLCVDRASLCGKHGLKSLTDFKLPPPTLSHKCRTWLKVQLELGADLLLFPLTAFCVADWFESSVSYTYKTHTLFVLLVALVIVASLNSRPE